MYSIKTSQGCEPEDTTSAKDDEIKVLKAKLVAQCNEMRTASHDCDKTCAGEDPKDFEIYQLKCQLNKNQGSCKDDRLKNRECTKSCPGETAKQYKIANLECTLADLNDKKARESQFSDGRPNYTYILI